MGAFLLSTEVIKIAILFSQVKVQSADQSETFLIGGIPKEFEDLTESVQLEWFLQDIDSDETVQVHADAFLYGEGEVVNAKATPNTCSTFARTEDFARSAFFAAYCPLLLSFFI